ncbi:MAG: NAD-dependent malic enzyme [Candidatus Diapherotrites archaeon CG08_land_8_20_14_0_20_34_12]|nr:MAG: NAD-dependent malic enzyme [Candidatus Diapherotrites archaeon CG08_land_8_20_14_0_20_34_12]
MDIFKESLINHKKWKGKISTSQKLKLKSKKDLSLAYTPGVAEPCREIAKDKRNLYKYTMKSNSVAVISDGSAILGLGNLGAEASLPVMEGKALIFKEFANIDAFPIVIKTQDADKIVEIIENISPVFGAINIEDIAAPRCFYIEEKLQDIGIPVFHDDQHATAVVVLAGLINALKLAKKDFSECKIVVNGIGAAGTAITKLLLDYGKPKEILLCGKYGLLDPLDLRISEEQRKLARETRQSKRGSLADALKDADVFIGVSVPNIVSKLMVKSMNKKSIIFALANPISEISPKEAKQAGAFIVATGRSDFPNQVNNALVFPGFFRGLLDSKSKRATVEMKLAAAFALASIEKPNKEKILPNIFNKKIVPAVAKAVINASK